MDPFSLTVEVAGLVDLITTQSQEYVRKVKKAEEEINLLTVEVLSFKEVLERFTKMTQEDSFRLVPVSLLPEHAKGQLNEC